MISFQLQSVTVSPLMQVREEELSKQVTAALSGEGGDTEEHEDRKPNQMELARAAAGWVEL